MTEKDKNIAAIEKYIAAKPTEVQKLLQSIRKTVQTVAPKAEEKMGYGVPGFYLDGPLVYYAAFKRHLGFYPTPSGIKAFKKELAGYKTAEGSIQFPLDQPMPLGLIKKIVQYRVQENLQKKKTPGKKG